MKRVIQHLCGLLILLSVNYASFGQYSNNWYFGWATGTRLNFNTTPPTVTAGLCAAGEGSSAISDAAGNPLFYTNGVSIWDATVTPNTTFSTTMIGDGSGAQTAVIMPKPGTTNQWLVFTGNVDVDGTNRFGLNYYTVTGASATSGPFTISAVTNLTGTDAIGEGLCIIGSTQAGTSFWVIVREVNLPGGSTSIKAYPVSTAGVIGAPVISSASGLLLTAKIGYIKSNTCQNRLAFTYTYASGGKVEIYSFDTASGALVAGSLTTLNVANAYGVEWSPNDNYLYVSELGGQLHQFLVGAAGSAAAGWTDYTYAGSYGALQLGPDGKIYAAKISATSLGVVNLPNNAGAPGNFAASGVSIPNGVFRGLPTFPKSLIVTNPVITKPSVDTTICVNTSLTFGYQYGGSYGLGATDFKWDIFSPAQTTYTSASPTHNFSTLGGPYKVRVTIVDLCGRTWKDSMNVTVIAQKVPAGTVSCGSNSVTLTGTGAIAGDYPNYVWYDAASGGNPYGYGSPLTINYPDATNVPTNYWVEVAGAVSTSATGTGNLAPTDASMTWTDATINPMTFDVVADKIRLNTIDIKPDGWFSGSVCTGLAFNLTIRTSASAVIYSQNFSYPAATCGTVITLPIGADILQGNGYTIDITPTAPAGISFFSNSGHGGSTLTLGGNTVIRNYKPSTGYSYLADWNVTYNNYTITPTCSQRVLVTRSCALPVELSYFEAARRKEKVVLNWITSSEKDNDYFIVERSADGQNFQAIGNVDGKGNTSELSFYTFTDASPLASTSYYRLVQVDLNGDKHISPVRVVTSSEEQNILVYPNPSASKFNVVLPESFEGSVISVTDILGREVYTRTLGSSDSNTIVLDAEWPKGHYIVKWTSETTTKTIHIVKE